MSPKSFKNKKVTVMGIGLHGGGTSMIKWLAKNGAKVIATDKRPSEQISSSIKKIQNLKNVIIVTSQHRMEDFVSVDLVIKNPAIPWSNKYVKAAIDAGVSVEMDSSLFFQLVETDKVIGVTGTKGKTTTSLLVSQMLKEEKKDVVSVGIGREPIMTKLEKISKNSWVVFELSSWRCSALAKIKKSPKIAVMTNIFQDHLNYYSSMDDYIDDKKNIFCFHKKGDTAIFNVDDEILAPFACEAGGAVITYSMNGNKSESCVFVQEGKIKLQKDGETQSVIEISDIKLRGAHNVYNACAMCAVGLTLGISNSSMKKVLKTFKGGHHRLEFVDKIDNVLFYNDTTATTPESAIAGINSFVKPIHLICGGSNKNLKLDVFAKKISKDEHVVAVYLLEGSATADLKAKIEEFGGSEKIIDVFEDMESAVRGAYDNAKKKELILLSPGCASFGMFANEFERGEKFISATKKMCV